MSDAAAPIKICVISGARSEYGLMRWVMHDIRSDPRMKLQLMVIGSHLSKELGETWREIDADGFAIDARAGDGVAHGTKSDLVAALGRMTIDIGEGLHRLNPDVCLFMGDRYEMLAAGSACVLMTIPVAHVSGGEITEGAIDDQIRHALTKIAHLHLVANATYAARIKQMGEESWRICVCGAPGLDNVRKLKLMTHEALAVEFGLPLDRPTALVTYHPETLAAGNPEGPVDDLLSAICDAELDCVITYPNADFGSGRIIEKLQAFAAARPNKVKLFKNLGQVRYLSALKHVDLIIGNSSSGIVEAPSFNLPAVNIGERQAGRIRARNVIDCRADRNSIKTAIAMALAYDRSGTCDNPYGDGRSSDRVREFIHDRFAEHGREGLLRKHFVDRCEKAARE